MNKIPLQTPTMHEEEQVYIKEAFDTNWIAPLGKNVDEFEKELKNYVGTKAALACISGTSSLFLAYKLAGIKEGSTVFVSDMTFAATVNPVKYLGGNPVFIDSERDTWNMSPEALEKAFEKYPECKCVCVAHLYGTPAKIDEIKDICKKHGAVFIEDAAESLSSEYKGTQTGSFGDYGIISFNGNKIITTSGGGMLLSDNEDAINKAKFWATQARDPAPWYEHSEIGYNFRMSNILAGIGRGQLKHIAEHKEKKKKIYMRYKEGFKNLPISMNPYLSCTEPNFWLSAMLIDKGINISPIKIYETLNSENIESRPIWKPMHMQPVYAKNDFISAGNERVDEDIFARGLCLPSDVKMTEEEQERVIGVIKSCFEVL